MKNILYHGLRIRREDLSTEIYWGWTPEEIGNLEKAYHNVTKFEVVAKVFEIENEFHRYEFLLDTGVFRDYNEVEDEITELETDHAVAHYLWTAATEAVEESTRAFNLMALELFGTFDKWRAMAFWHVMREFEVDAVFIKEGAAS